MNQKITVDYAVKSQKQKDYEFDPAACFFRVKNYRHNSGTAYFAQFQTSNNTLIVEIEVSEHHNYVKTRKMLRGWCGTCDIRKFLSENAPEVETISKSEFLNAYKNALPMFDGMGFEKC